MEKKEGKLIITKSKRTLIKLPQRINVNCNPELFVYVPNTFTRITAHLGLDGVRKHSRTTNSMKPNTLYQLFLWDKPIVEY